MLETLSRWSLFYLFQAEDGILDGRVTGVQTCALPISCRADELLEHALETVRSQLCAKNLKLSVNLGASNHQIMADPTRIEQVFWNLLKNAYKFTPEKIGRASCRERVQ